MDGESPLASRGERKWGKGPNYFNVRMEARERRGRGRQRLRRRRNEMENLHPVEKEIFGPPPHSHGHEGFPSSPVSEIIPEKRSHRE